MVAATVLLVAGCTRAVNGTAVVGVPRVGTPVKWSKCETTSHEGGLPAGTECGLLSVPVDYAKPTGEVTQLALIRFKATGDKIGSLVMNPGGPGASGVDAALDLVGALPAEVRARFDFVGFDPRGVGFSRPAVRCNSDQENDRMRADPQVDYSPAGVAHLEAQNKEFVARCVDKMGKDFLANIGTATVAKDLDALRAALGDEKLTYLGYSYGTRIGSAYAEAFPQRVRAMILDGAVDPNSDPTEDSIRQDAAFQQAFNDFAADCAKKSDCPLGTDPAKVVATYHSLVDPLVKTPAKTQDPRQLSYQDAVTGTVQALYSPNLWGHLTDGLTELRHGQGDTLLALADMYMDRDEHGHYGNMSDAGTAISCVDDPPVTDRSKVVDADRRSREVAPFMSYGQFTGDAPLGDCAFWPVPPTSTPHQVSVHGLPPLLVVSTTDDPATPYQSGVALAKELGGSLLTYRGTQHTVVFDGHACVDDIAAKYLIDVKVPPPGATC